MDELERDLRATFDNLADVGPPDDALVGRTLVRRDQIRRRRRVLTASGFATGALVVTLVGASLAGAGTRGHVQISEPGGSGIPAASSTTEPPSTTTTSTTLHRYTSTTVSNPLSTTTVPIAATPPACNPPVVDDTVAAGTSSGGGDFVLLANGDVQVSYTFFDAPIPKRYDYFVLDDGDRGQGFIQTYTPAQFGPHSFDEWTAVDGVPNYGCSTRHNFIVDPATARPDPHATTTTVPDGTTVPVATTVPDTTTVAGP